MVAARRVFEGSLPLSSLPRLRDALHDAGAAAGLGDPGPVRFAIEFDRDALQVPYVELRIEAQLPLECQRTLRPFLHPVHVVQRLGLIVDEADEAGLPPDYESLLLAADGAVRPVELVEDELILAVPLVPTCPGSEEVAVEAGEVEAMDEPQANPFAALAALKDQATKNN